MCNVKYNKRLLSQSLIWRHHDQDKMLIKENIWLGVCLVSETLSIIIMAEAEADKVMRSSWELYPDPQEDSKRKPGPETSKSTPKDPQQGHTYYSNKATLIFLILSNSVNP